MKLQCHSNLHKTCKASVASVAPSLGGVVGGPSTTPPLLDLALLYFAHRPSRKAQHGPQTLVRQFITVETCHSFVLPSIAICTSKATASTERFVLLVSVIWLLNLRDITTPSANRQTGHKRQPTKTLSPFRYHHGFIEPRRLTYTSQTRHCRVCRSRGC